MDLQPLALPDTLDPLVVDCPARLAQQFGDLAIAIAAVLLGKLDNIGGETLLVVMTRRVTLFYSILFRLGRARFLRTARRRRCRTRQAGQGRGSSAGQNANK